ncbi:MAG: hypothetical protein LBR66_09155 [Candidatus Symbiothrix sp.]|nr:hypothetical protein [Candidatus Symbiothrix sp.]
MSDSELLLLLLLEPVGATSSTLAPSVEEGVEKTPCACAAMGIHPAVVIIK